MYVYGINEIVCLFIFSSVYAGSHNVDEFFPAQTQTILVCQWWTRHYGTGEQKKGWFAFNSFPFLFIWDVFVCFFSVEKKGDTKCFIVLVNACQAHPKVTGINDKDT